VGAICNRKIVLIHVWNCSPRQPPALTLRPLILAVGVAKGEDRPGNSQALAMHAKQAHRASADAGQSCEFAR
jgi:hypothetical protein